MDYAELEVWRLVAHVGDDHMVGGRSGAFRLRRAVSIMPFSARWASRVLASRLEAMFATNSAVTRLSLDDAGT